MVYAYGGVDPIMGVAKLGSFCKGTATFPTDVDKINSDNLRGGRCLWLQSHALYTVVVLVSILFFSVKSSHEFC
jgi:hypothetical protein